jgi:hypothetical protein
LVLGFSPRSGQQHAITGIGDSRRIAMTNAIAASVDEKTRMPRGAQSANMNVKYEAGMSVRVKSVPVLLSALRSVHAAPASARSTASRARAASIERTEHCSYS